MLLSGALWNMFIFFTFSGAFSFMHLSFFRSACFLIILLSFNQSSFILSLFLFFLCQTNIKANTTSRASKPPTLNPLWAFLCIMKNILYTMNSPFSSHLSVLEPAFSGSKAHHSCASDRPVCLFLHFMAKLSMGNTSHPEQSYLGSST